MKIAIVKTTPDQFTTFGEDIKMLSLVEQGKIMNSSNDKHENFGEILPYKSSYRTLDTAFLL